MLCPKGRSVRVAFVISREAFRSLDEWSRWLCCPQGVRGHSMLVRADALALVASITQDGVEAFRKLM
jgi:hypothetical protein